MSQIKKNVVANYAGSFCTALMALIFIPLYIKFMGIEAYGLVGVFASLLAVFGVLDMGLSATMTREMARLSTLDPTGSQTRSLARTLEVIYWVVGLLLGLVMLGLAGPIADHWVKPDRLEPATVRHALVITGGVVALRWPVAFYCGGLRGLDRQPLLNLILCVCATLRGVGSVLVLWLISPTIEAYFWYQIVISAVETSWLVAALWQSLPGRGTATTFTLVHLKRVWRFSAGMTGISVLALLLTQTDKIILSKMLSLELFGYYTLAWAVASGLLRLIDPIDAAVYPTLTRLVAQEQEEGLVSLYHRSCQLQIVLLVPAALMLILFGDSVLTIWSGDADLVRNASPVLRILAIGMCLNGFMHIPYFTQLAFGWTSLIFYQNVASVIILVPLVVVLTWMWQGLGAAYVWVILNAGYVLIIIPIMHRRILPEAKWDWYIYDVALPASAALTAALIGRLLLPTGLPLAATAACVLTTAGFVFLATVLAAKFPRGKLFEVAKSLKTRVATIC